MKKKRWKRIVLVVFLLIVFIVLAGLISWLLPGLRASWTIRQAVQGELQSFGGTTSFAVSAKVIPWVFFPKGQCLCAHLFSGEIRFYDKEGKLLLQAEYCEHCFDVKEIEGAKVNWNLAMEPSFYQFLCKQQEKMSAKQRGKKEKKEKTSRNKKGKDKP